MIQNKLYENNLQVLASVRPELYQQVLSCDLGGYELVSNSDKYNILVSGKPVYLTEHETLSKTLNPDFSTLNYPKFMVFYGLGLGEQFYQLYPKLGSQTEFIYIIEKSLEFFVLSLKVFDWTQIIRDMRIVIMLGFNSVALRDHLIEAVIGSRAMYYTNVLVSYFHPAAVSLDEVYYRSAVDAMAATSQYNILGDEEDAYRGFMNVAKNLNHAANAHHHDILMHQFAGVPAVVVSSGPSLIHSLAWLKSIQGKAIIACADSALKTLLQNGIVPDFVGCLERVAETRHFFEDLPPLPDTYLLACPVVYPESYQKYPGPILHLMRYQAQLQWFFPEGNYFQAGSSVANMNFLALELMDCSPLYLVGQDLAYDRNSNKTHAVELPASVHKQNQMQRKQAMEQATELSVIGNDGKPILTSKTFSEFRDLFERRIRLHKLKVYNVIPKSYGAKIDGAIVVDPSEISSHFIPSTIDIKQKLNALLQPIDKQVVKQRKQAIVDRLSLALQRLDEYQALALKILDTQSEFVFLHNPMHYEYDQFKPLLRKIEQIGSMITNDKENFYHHFFYPQTYSYYYRLDQQLNEVFVTNPPYPEVFSFQFNHIVNWFREMYYWSGRMKNYLLEHAKIDLGEK